MYTLAANQGLVEAQFNLAICYAKGEGVTQDLAEAVRWCAAAADQGLVEAREFLTQISEVKQIS